MAVLRDSAKQWQVFLHDLIESKFVMSSENVSAWSSPEPWGLCLRRKSAALTLGSYPGRARPCPRFGTFYRRCPG